MKRHELRSARGRGILDRKRMSWCGRKGTVSRRWRLLLLFRCRRLHISCRIRRLLHAGALLRGLLLALLRSFSLGNHLLLGTRLASWLLPFDGTRDPELSVSKRDSTGREPCGTETREREDSNKEVREKKEGGRKTPTDSFSPDHRFLLLF